MVLENFLKIGPGNFRRETDRGRQRQIQTKNTEEAEREQKEDTEKARKKREVNTEKT